ncbi:MAG: CRISPR-associated endoribonuclease Cas6 [Candidatus Atabeyarchaeum deiterrae]
MRLLLTFSTLDDFSYDSINKHTVQGLVYSLIREEDVEEYHNLPKFKFFCFSDIFPIDDFRVGQEKNILISSPNEYLIESMAKTLRAERRFKLGDHEIEARYKVVRPDLSSRFISASPITIYEDSRENRYYSFERSGDLSFFLQRIKENAIRKYNAFYSEKYDLAENIFDRLVFRKEVSVRAKRGEKEFIIIGSVWKLLEKYGIDTVENRKFYEFIMDCGLGEKNSLGFGFINPLR